MSYVIRETFVAKPGQASKLAKLMKEAMGMMPRGNGKTRIMTDFVGPFNTVVMDTEVEDISTFDREMKDYMTDPKLAQFRDKMKGYTEMYQEGRREIFRTIE